MLGLCSVLFLSLMFVVFLHKAQASIKHLAILLPHLSKCNESSFHVLCSFFPHSMYQAGLKLEAVLLPQSPESWDSKFVLLHPEISILLKSFGQRIMVWSLGGSSVGCSVGYSVGCNSSKQHKPPSDPDPTPTPVTHVKSWTC